LYRLQLGGMINHLVQWLLLHYSYLFNSFSSVIGKSVNEINLCLGGLPWWLLIAVFAGLAWYFRGWRLALGSALGLLLIYDLQLWPVFLNTLVLIIVATIIAVVLGIPLGIISGISRRFHDFFTPILDFMQTMPSFVYLIPALMFFGLGIVPAVFATIIFGMPPVIRLTDLGIRQLPHDMVEVGEAFGSNTWQLLWKIQVPLAVPSIMAGINQTMMLSLSMVVIAAMIGAGGLGQGVLQGISQMNIGLGFENGVAVVILAMVLDKLSQGFLVSLQKREKKQPAESGNRLQQLFRRRSLRVAIALCLVVAILGTGYYRGNASSNTGNKGTVTIGYINWQEDVAVTYIWQEILQDQGYNVELKNLDVAPLFVGLSRGDIDIFLDSWLPITEKHYWDTYKDHLDDLGSWYQGEAKIGFVVPKYVTINSITQMNQYRDKFGGQVIGYDPGSESMTTAANALKGYGVNFKLVSGSEAAMIAALDKAYRQKQWVAILGWSPHWMWAKYDLKYLEDSKKSFGESEGLHILTPKGYGQERPEIVSMLKKFKMNDQQLGTITAWIQQGMKPKDAAKKWISENQSLVASWTQ
jgi:ABC-type proline/glycine betaine transport system permease subunit/ABC-type proline/glycine betaine transport system substrate-binding protein